MEISDPIRLKWCNSCSHVYLHRLCTNGLMAKMNKENNFNKVAFGKMTLCGVVIGIYKYICMYALLCTEL